MEAGSGASAGSSTTREPIPSARAEPPRLDHEPDDRQVEGAHHVEDRLHHVTRRPAQQEQDQQERSDLLELMDEAPGRPRDQIGRKWPPSSGGSGIRLKMPSARLKMYVQKSTPASGSATKAGASASSRLSTRTATSATKAVVKFDRGPAAATHAMSRIGCRRF